MQRFVVPGALDVTLSKPGVMTIFHEPKGLIDAKYSMVESLAGLRLSLVPAAGGEAVPLTVPEGNATYNMGGHAGTAIAGGPVRTPGRYRLTAAYDDGRSEPKAVLAAAKNFTTDLLRTTFGGIAIMGATLIGAIGVFLLVFFKRRRVLRPETPVAAQNPSATTQTRLTGSILPPIAGSPNTATSVMRFAGPGRRVVEGSLDLVGILVVFGIVSQVFGNTSGTGNSSLLGWAFLVFLFVFVPLYYVAMEATVGATLGKFVVGVRVVSESDGAPIGWGKALARTALRVVDGFLFGLVGFVVICATEKSQRVGDKVAGTVVVRVRGCAIRAR